MTEVIDKFETAISTLCGKLDELLYFPFKDRISEPHNLGVQKEKFKSSIEEVIVKLKESIGRPYQKREFCKDQCPIQNIIDEMLHHGKDIKEVKDSICKKHCVKTTWEFHDWLQRKGFKIIKEDE